MLLPQPRSTLFPYTTLFRSSRDVDETRTHRSLSASRGLSGVRRQESRTRLAGKRLRRARQLDESAEGRSGDGPARSEEHTSELQSLRHLVCRLLLEKKKRST